MVTVTNAAPIAVAGTAQGVVVSTTVTLDGSGSSDPDGHGILSYGWTQTGGPAVILSDSTAISPTFIAPDSPTVITFTLTVTDSFGLASAPDSVVVTVSDMIITTLDDHDDGDCTLADNLPGAAQSR